jgi:hypothetical protein
MSDRWQVLPAGGHLLYEGNLVEGLSKLGYQLDMGAAQHQLDHAARGFDEVFGADEPPPSE